MRLENKKILITGAAGFLGSKIVETLLDEKAYCLLLDKNYEQLKKIKYRLNQKNYYNFSIFKVDITSEKQVKKSFQIINEKYKKLDGILNFAAIDPKVNKKSKLLSSFEKTNLKELKLQIDVGIYGLVLLTKYYISLLKKSHLASVVNIASDLSVISPDHRIYGKKDGVAVSKPISYSIIKHGVVGFTKYLATYYGKENIRFNCISPGGIYAGQPKSFLKKINKLVPMNRMGNVEDIKYAIVHLLSSESKYTNGVNLIIDGGRSIW
jgi:NAD(P)-dependent dehydrogenase (short-subunit alcohol dehydrogenase family)